VSDGDDNLRPKKVAAGSGGEPAAREPGRGTGRGGDVTGPRTNSFCQRRNTAACLKFQRDDEAVATVGRESPSETQRLGSDCDCRFT
jgi:hypothetical protein